MLICSVGTEIFYRTADGSLVPDQAWQAYLDKGWDRAAVESVAAKFPQLKQQVSDSCAVLGYVGVLVEAWEAQIDQGWDRAAVEAVAAKFPQLKQQVRDSCLIWLKSWRKPENGGRGLQQQQQQQGLGEAEEEEDELLGSDDDDGEGGRGGKYGAHRWVL
jgi:uncharacterized protein YukE